MSEIEGPTSEHPKLPLAPPYRPDLRLITTLQQSAREVRQRQARAKAATTDRR